MDSHTDLKFGADTGIEVLYRAGNLVGIEFVDDIITEFNKHCLDLDLPLLETQHDYDQDFLIPDNYKNLDVMEYIANLVPEHPGRQARVAQELEMFQARNLFPILQMLIYIVDQMRTHDIVWGVGRGSSVASYCLYLLGVHRIDSYAYDLPIQEFLK